MPGIDNYLLDNYGLDGDLHTVSSAGRNVYASSPSSVIVSATSVNDPLRRYKYIKINHIGGVFHFYIVVSQGESVSSAGKVCFYINGIPSSSIFNVSYAAGGMTYSHEASINPGDMVELYASANSGFNFTLRNFFATSSLEAPIVASS